MCYPRVKAGGAETVATQKAKERPLVLASCSQTLGRSSAICYHFSNSWLESDSVANCKVLRTNKNCTKMFYALYSFFLGNIPKNISILVPVSIHISTKSMNGMRSMGSHHHSTDSCRLLPVGDLLRGHRGRRLVPRPGSAFPGLAPGAAFGVIVTP